ncbi:hypothetical protein NL676_006109 [Syzygium grande]|nr:hypothetical protein NL676_006109 [Syzygium grande]
MEKWGREDRKRVGILNCIDSEPIAYCFGPIRRNNPTIYCGRRNSAAKMAIPTANDLLVRNVATLESYNTQFHCTTAPHQSPSTGPKFI